MKKVAILIILLFLLTGCDYKELSEISIATVLGIDKQKDIYTISSLVVGKEENETLLYTGKGSSITTALSNLNLNLSENLYLNHVQTVLVSEKIAKEGMEPILDYFIKNDSIQNNFYLFLAHDASAEDILKSLLKNSQNNYNTVTNIFKYNDEIEFTNKSDSITEFLDSLLKKGKEPTLNSITIQNDAITTSKLGIFKKDKLYSFSGNMMGIALLSNRVDHIILNIPCKQGESVIEVNNIEVKTKYVNKEIHNKIKGTIDIKENVCAYDIRKDNDKKEVTKKVQKEIQNLLAKTIHESKTNRSDVFGFGNKIYQKEKKLNYHYFEKLDIENEITLKMKKEDKEVYHE